LKAIIRAGPASKVMAAKTQNAEEEDPLAIIKVMAAIFTGLLTLLLLQFNTMNKSKVSTSIWIASKDNPEKRSYEIFCLKYTVIWIACFAAIVAFQLYESFDEVGYFVVCGGLCIPLFAYPFWTGNSYSMKASVWLIIYSFIGNYWYTHYFYSVLKASYSMPSWRLNNVPIPLYFATFFYFSTYHVFSNMAIRKVVTSFEPTLARTLFLMTMIFAMSYFTAFAEAFTISSFPYYSFEDRNMAYSVGSAFYGIYFLVSFPMFYRLNENPSEKFTLWQYMVDSFGSGMMILCILDFVRLALGISLTIEI